MSRIFLTLYSYGQLVRISVADSVRISKLSPPCVPDLHRPDHFNRSSQVVAAQVPGNGGSVLEHPFPIVPACQDPHSDVWPVPSATRLCPRANAECESRATPSAVADHIQANELPPADRKSTRLNSSHQLI